MFWETAAYVPPYGKRFAGRQFFRNGEKLPKMFCVRRTLWYNQSMIIMRRYAHGEGEEPVCLHVLRL